MNGLNAASRQGVVVQPEEIQLVFFDDADDLFLHPLGSLGIGKVQQAPHFPFALVVHGQPIWMFLGHTTVVPNSFRVHPESPKHASSVNPVAEWLHSFGKTMPIHVPVADRRPPVTLRGRVPTGINKEDFGPNLYCYVDGVVHLLRCDLDLGTDSGLYPGRSSPRLWQEHAAPQVRVHSLNGGVEIAKHKS